MIASTQDKLNVLRVAKGLMRTGKKLYESGSTYICVAVEMAANELDLKCAGDAVKRDVSYEIEYKFTMVILLDKKYGRNYCASVSEETVQKHRMDLIDKLISDYEKELRNESK